MSENVNQVARQVREIKRNLEDNVLDEVEGAADRAATSMQLNVVGNNTVWRMNLFRSIGVSRFDNNVSISANTPYAAMVEFGTGSRRSPLAPSKFQFDSPRLTDSLRGAIINWVMTKPYFAGDRTITTGMQIAESIAEKGTHPHPFMRPAWHGHRSRVIESAKRGVRKTLRDA
jgi:HK97 gp10 family phage protein